MANKSLEAVIVIPARLKSTRLERKLLRQLGDKSIIEKTFAQASKSKLASEVYIACDDDELVEHCLKFTDNVRLTSDQHQSGSDRIAELAQKNRDWQVIVNVQGDEPFINPADIDKAIEPFIHDPKLEMLSLYHQITATEEINKTNNVKVVTDANDMALYFSRQAIPFKRDADSLDDVIYKKHIGLYAYRKETLLALSSMPQSKLELSEKLEQLRALENGIAIKMIEVSSAPIGIDTDDDLQKAQDLLSQ